MGLDYPGQIDGARFYRRVSATQVRSYLQLFPPLAPGALLDGAAPADWRPDWDAATPDRF